MSTCFQQRGPDRDRIFALPANGFDTLEFFDENRDSAEDGGILGWLTGSVRFSSDPICVWTDLVAPPNHHLDTSHAPILFLTIRIPLNPRSQTTPPESSTR